MGFFSKRWQKKVRDFCDGQYEVIEVIPGEINFYYKCHIVAVHYAYKHNQKKIALVVYREKDSYLPRVHFINYYKTDKEYVDNTMGYWAKHHEYRFIRWVPESEFPKVMNILDDTQKFFNSMSFHKGE